MKRVCFIVDSIFSIGGVQRVTTVIAKELAKDFDVTILSFDKVEKKDTTMYGLNEANITFRFLTYPPISDFKKKLCKVYSGIYLKLQLQSQWSSNLYAKSSYPSELRNALLAELKQEDFDIIVGVHAPLAARLATLRKDLPKAKLIGWLHNSYEALFGENSHYYIGAKRKRHYVYQFRYLDEVILLCQHDADCYCQYDQKFHPTVIYNPLTIKPGEKSNGSSRRFLAVGRFSQKHKGFDLLIKAFKLFAQKNSEWVLDIVGEGPEEKMYQELIREYRLEDRIIIHPFTNQVQDYYTNAQIYVLSSRWEGFGLVLVEAMSHGLPIISSDLPVSQEILGDFGLFFENENIEDLAQRLEDATLIDWQAKSQEAIKIAQRFDISHIIEQWKQLLEK